MLTILLALAVQLPVTDTVPQSPADSFLDEGAVELLAGARARSDSSYARIEGYRMVSREGMSISLSSSRRDRLIARREQAWRVSWRRNEEWRVEVLASREIIPSFMSEPDVGGAAHHFPSLDPEAVISSRGQWLLRLPDGDDDDVGIRHPLVRGSEINYRFQSGDTTAIRLPDGRTVTILELRVIPRRSHASLLSGSFWLEATTHAPVRGVFSLAAPATFDLEGPGGIELLPIPDLALQLDFFTMEYALVGGEWWLPRLVSMQGSGKVGAFRVPFLMEQSFEEYEVFSRGDPWVPLAPIDTVTYRRVSTDGDSVDGQERVVIVPRDTAALLTGPYLPESMFDPGPWLTSAVDLEQLERMIGMSRSHTLGLRRPDVDWVPFDAGLLRYNRVEGLAVGTSATVELDPYRLSARAWIGLADLTPSFQIDFERLRFAGLDALNLYSSLHAFTPADRPFSFGNSTMAFFFGRDDGDYFRASGAALSTSQRFGGSTSGEAAITLFAETQRPVSKNTDTSIAHWTSDATFQANLAADRADQIGMEGEVSTRRGLDPGGFRGTIAGRTRAEAGTFRFAKPSLELYGGFPLPGRVLGSLELSTGAIFGDAPPQSLWYLGGPSTVRGFGPADRIVGTAFWRARGELATQRPAFRIVLFTDAGWAGARQAATLTPSLVSAGVGGSLMDGLVRADVAKAVRGGSGWGVQLYLDAPL